MDFELVPFLSQLRTIESRFEFIGSNPIQK